jgi:translation elongation factor EF-Ts
MGSKFNESDVKELIEVTGSTRAKVEEALVINDGNKEHAAAYLIN